MQRPKPMLKHESCIYMNIIYYKTTASNSNNDDHCKMTWNLKLPKGHSRMRLTEKLKHITATAKAPPIWCSEHIPRVRVCMKEALATEDQQGLCSFWMIFGNCSNNCSISIVYSLFGGFSNGFLLYLSNSPMECSWWTSSTQPCQAAGWGKPLLQPRLLPAFPQEPGLAASWDSSTGYHAWKHHGIKWKYPPSRSLKGKQKNHVEQSCTQSTDSFHIQVALTSSRTSPAWHIIEIRQSCDFPPIAK